MQGQPRHDCTVCGCTRKKECIIAGLNLDGRKAFWEFSLFRHGIGKPRKTGFGAATIALVEQEKGGKGLGWNKIGSD